MWCYGSRFLNMFVYYERRKNSYNEGKNMQDHFLLKKDAANYAISQGRSFMVVISVNQFPVILYFVHPACQVYLHNALNKWYVYQICKFFDFLRSIILDSIHYYSENCIYEYWFLNIDNIMSPFLLHNGILVSFFPNKACVIFEWVNGKE